MFVGREQELRALERMYQKPDFQMAVIYGRRRVGKTTLIDKFVENKPTLYFTAQQKSTLQNLQALSRVAYSFFGLPEDTGAFSSWTQALAFLAEKAHEQHESGEAPTVFVFDEFPYAAEADHALPSILQNEIDHGFKQTDFRIILCGSNEGFMESNVLGRKSPLYGRRTLQMRVRPFDYFDSARMLPELKPEDWMLYYATFGGTPYYLSQVSESSSYQENIEELIFTMTGLLYEEPLMLLRQELREPALYNSILDAIGSGATTPQRIAERAGVKPDSIGKYLKTLVNLGIIRKDIPFGENPVTSRKGIYHLEDPFFAYWYAFASKNIGAIEMGAGRAVAQKTASSQALTTYVGRQFESACLQWLARENAKNALPFLATSFGRWWGSDPQTKEEVDIDVIAADKESSSALFSECKWRNSFDESHAIDLLERRSALVKGFENRWLVLFSKNPASAGTLKKASERNDLQFVTVDDLYADML